MGIPHTVVHLGEAPWWVYTTRVYLRVHREACYPPWVYLRVHREAYTRVIHLRYIGRHIPGYKALGSLF